MQGLVQVYGGTISIMIGSYSWSYANTDRSLANSGDTYCSSCAVDVSDVAIINSTAVSSSFSNNGAFVRAGQRALGFLCVQLTMVAQVYGGSMSFVVGAYLWSLSEQFIAAYYEEGTVVSGLSMVFDNNHISGSQAVTSTKNLFFSTIEGALQAQNPTFEMHAHAHVNLFTHFERR
jgi:hypothetical protein